MKNTAANLVHQEFDTGNQRTYIVRQDRIECDPDRHKIQISSETAAPVVNFGAFGVALETNFDPADEYADVSFLVDGYPINQLTMRKVRQQKTDRGTYLTGYSLSGEPLDVEAVLAVKSLNEILAGVSGKVQEDSTLKESFRLKVLEIKDLLLKLENEVNGLAKDSFKTDLTSISHFEDRIAARVSNYFSQALSPLYKELSETMSDLSREQILKYFDYFRSAVGPIMYQSAYAHRAFYKPKGYAGDFEMMNHVYHRELRGHSLFAKCLQRYFVDEPAGRAVRNREEYLRTKIRKCLSDKKGGVKLLSVASGPAMEVQNTILEQKDLTRVEFHLLDQDLDALKFAQRRILQAAASQKKEVRVVLHHLAIKNVIQMGLPQKDFDLIYSAGLFDYFTDPVAVYAAKQLFAGLKKGGELIIGNFSMNNPNQFAMGLIMDWNLIYRSEKKMEELFSSVGGKYWLEQENEGINFFANIQKQG